MSYRRKISSKFVNKIIQHTESHNKVQEENFMYKQRRLELDTEEESRSSSSHRHRMQEHSKVRKSAEPASSQARRLNRELVAAKSAFGKWDHSGFAALYPDEINDPEPVASTSKEPRNISSPISVHSSSSSESHRKHKKKQKRRRHSLKSSSSSSSTRQKKSKRKKSHHKHHHNK